MPKTFTDSAKKKWLDLYESGKTEKWIAREHVKCDLRTVKRGIEEARRKQDARIARAELMKEALRKHQDSLMEELDNILSSLEVPAKDSVVLSWYHDGDSIFTQPETSVVPQTDEVPKSSRISGSRGEMVRGLLKQHLKNDRLWKVLAQWDKVYANNIMARKDLQVKTVNLIEEKTGYKLTDRGDAIPPFVCSYTTGNLFFTTILHRAFGTSKNIDVENDFVANIGSGEVRYRDSLILAVAPGTEEKTKRNLSNALKALKVSLEINPVVNTYKTLEEITMRARQVVEQIKLLGLIPGQCEICRRLGM